MIPTWIDLISPVVAFIGAGGVTYAMIEKMKRVQPIILAIVFGVSYLILRYAADSVVGAAR